MASRKKSENPLDKLDPKRKKYVQERAKGKSKKDSALGAGFTESMALNAAAKIETEDVRLAFRTLVRQAIPPQKIVDRLSEGMDADRTTSVESDETTENGRKRYVEITEPDFRERREYLKLAANFGGYYVDKQEIDLNDKSPSSSRLEEILARAIARSSNAPNA